MRAFSIGVGLSGEYLLVLKMDPGQICIQSVHKLLHLGTLDVIWSSLYLINGGRGGDRGEEKLFASFPEALGKIDVKPLEIGVDRFPRFTLQPWPWSRTQRTAVALPGGLSEPPFTSHPRQSLCTSEFEEKLFCYTYFPSCFLKISAPNTHTFNFP